MNFSKLMSNETLDRSVYGKYDTEVLTKRAIKVIQNHKKSGSQQPLFMYLAYKAIHTPIKNLTSNRDRFVYELWEEEGGLRIGNYKLVFLTTLITRLSYEASCVRISGQTHGQDGVKTDDSKTTPVRDDKEPSTAPTLTVLGRVKAKPAPRTQSPVDQPWESTPDLRSRRPSRAAPPPPPLTPNKTTPSRESPTARPQEAPSTQLPRGSVPKRTYIDNVTTDTEPSKRSKEPLTPL
ncbi:hypothetical protein C0Q70_11330 [Pomacea canaliculata]|uniref:Uncharacterized protein n=1 Tax=Pomacea canaliculata TaxID=400727 RepID=A0A2T7P5Q9_POMCA|nr:hypothetical protein C0Q70_11330 [Pomacea canaliculata]